MPPLKIIILLNLHTSSAPLIEQMPASVAESQATKNFLKELKEEGLIELAREAEGGDHPFQTTDRGQAYIKALTSLPLPVQQWVMPS